MVNWIRFEINFHQQDELSIFQESTLSGFDEEFYEIVAFINYSIRQMSNLGNGEAADTLASTLAAAPSAIDALASGRPSVESRWFPILAALAERGSLPA